MNDLEKLLYRIAITMTPSVGPVHARNLISYCGSPEAVFRAGKKELMKIPGIGEKTAEFIVSRQAVKNAEAELKHLQNHDIRALFYLDKEYPARLAHFQDAPMMLYYKGTADLNAARIVGIVGTRQPTPAGVAICEELVENLSSYNVIVISGLAYGIDVTAHKKSFEKGIPTIGVLGHGFRQIYPAQHRNIADRMTGNGGLLTEFTYNTTPVRENFPMRNRIIAGLSDALVVVETAERGGSMITAQIANAYNKDVFAVPGRLKDKYSQGCNKLIKTNMALLIESAEDIGYIMRWNAKNKAAGIQTRLFEDLNEQERKIVDLLKYTEEIGIDKLGYEASLTAGEISSILLEMEFKGLVKSLPGKRYMLA